MRQESSVRQAMGRTLRQLRERSQLSLDQVDQASGIYGARVTRSHLSRVENGQADLALPRFLTLMRTLGEPAGDVVHTLDALLDPGPRDGEEPGRIAEACWRAGDLAGATASWRRAFVLSGAALPEPTLERWAAAEAGLGRWGAAARVLQQRIAYGERILPHVALQLAVASLGNGRSGLAQVFAQATAETARAPSLLVMLATELCRGGAAAVAEPAARAADGAQDGHLRAGALMLAVEGFRDAGRPRAALRLAQRAVEQAPAGAAHHEAALALARVFEGLNRPQAGLRLVKRAAAAARADRLPELLVRCHRTAEALWTRAGSPRDAQLAARSARALARRLGVEPPLRVPVPLQTLWEAAARSAAPAVRP
jgi:transcriptional regulator with XRE-family HTH domain